MARELLTDKRIAAMRAPETGRKEVFDTVRTGLCFRLTEHGARSWSVMYKFNGDLRRDTLGPYPKIRLAAARQLAGDALEAAGRGEDPRLIKAAIKAKMAAKAADTVEAVGETFIAKHAAQRRWREIEGIMRRDVMTTWLGRPVSDIGRREIIELVDAVVDRGAPVQANRVLVVLKIFFGWAMDRGIIQADPTARVRKPTKERKRERILTDPEIAALWRGCEAIGEPFGPLFKALLLTGQRLGEIAGLEWPEFLESDRRIEIAGAKYKTAKPHALPLPAAAQVILAQRPKIEGCSYMCTTNGRTPVSGFSKAKAALNAAMLAELRKDADAPDKITQPHWTLHDVRRTCRSGLSRLGVRPDIGEMILGHSLGGIRETYDRHNFEPEMRHALETWAAHIAGVLNPRPKSAKVVKFRK